jgi:DNA-binding LacI/PurR family transcriptional regulator
MGYEAAMESHKIEVRPEWKMNLQPGSDALTADVLRLLKLPESIRPSAFCGINDHEAATIISAVRSQGLNIPEDVSVTGFDDLPLAREPEWMITTVRQPLQALGAASVDLLLNMVKGGQIEKKVLTFELIERSTVGRAPK